MKNNIITINGLSEGVSVVEKDNQQPQKYAINSDILYNAQEHDSMFQDLYREEGFSVSEYNADFFKEQIPLLSTIEETIVYKTEDILS